MNNVMARFLLALTSRLPYPSKRCLDGVQPAMTSRLPSISSRRRSACYDATLSLLMHDALTAAVVTSQLCVLLTDALEKSTRLG